MTSSPDPGGRGFRPASTAPAPVPRVFIAAPAEGAPRPARAFEAFDVPGGTEGTAKVREAARAAGYAEGWAAGMRQAASRAAAERAVEREMADLSARNAELARVTALQRVESAVLAAARRLQDREDPHVGALADTVLELALDLAGAVLDRELSLMESPVLDAVQRALRPLDPAQPVTVRVHPEDLVVLTGEGLKSSAAGAETRSVTAPVTFVPDRTLQPGDAVAQQGDTQVDARLRASVTRALDALVGDPLTASGQVPAGATGQSA